MTYLYQYHKQEARRRPFGKMLKESEAIWTNGCLSCDSWDGTITSEDKTFQFKEGDWLVIKDKKIYQIKKVN